MPPAAILMPHVHVGSKSNVTYLRVPLQIIIGDKDVRVRRKTISSSNPFDKVTQTTHTASRMENSVNTTVNETLLAQLPMPNVIYGTVRPNDPSFVYIIWHSYSNADRQPFGKRSGPARGHQ